MHTTETLSYCQKCSGLSPHERRPTSQEGALVFISRLLKRACSTRVSVTALHGFPFRSPPLSCPTSPVYRCNCTPESYKHYRSHFEPSSDTRSHAAPAYPHHRPRVFTFKCLAITKTLASLAVPSPLKHPVTAPRRMCALQSASWERAACIWLLFAM